MSEPTVSVVLPTLDRAGVLERAIDSALSQTREPDELVVVDGGSTDGTHELLAAVDDPRLRVRDQASEGVAAARNEGIAASKGELVAFLDADDVWREDKLERQLTALQAEPAPAGVSYARLAKPEGEPRTRSGLSGWVPEAVQRMQVPTYTSTLLVRRPALEQAGGFDERLPCFEDWELCLRLARAWRFAFVDEPLVTKGTGDDNVSADPANLRVAVRRLRERHELPDATLARLLTDVGRTSCEAERFAQGRGYLARSLRHRPRQPVALLAWLAALPGSPRVYDACMAALYRGQRWLDGRG